MKKSIIAVSVCLILLTGCGDKKPGAVISSKPTETSVSENSAAPADTVAQTETSAADTEAFPSETSSETSGSETETDLSETSEEETVSAPVRQGPENGSCDTDYVLPSDDTLSEIFSGNDHIYCLKYTADHEYTVIPESAFDNFAEYRNSRSKLSEKHYREWVDGLKDYLGDDDEAALSYEEYKKMICDMYQLDPEPAYSEEESVFFSIRGYDETDNSGGLNSEDYSSAFKFVIGRLSDGEQRISDLKKAAAENGSSCIAVSFEKHNDNTTVFAEFLCDSESYSEFSDEWTILNNETVS